MNFAELQNNPYINPIPTQILRFFPEGECKIDDEEKFLELFQAYYPQAILEDQAFHDYEYWEYLIFRIFERIDFRINNLKELKQNGFTDTQNLQINEKNINILLEALAVIFTEIGDGIRRLSFPFFEKLLELTSDFDIIQNLIDISVLFLADASYHNLINAHHLGKLFYYLTPFAKMFHYFDYDYKNIHDLFIAQIREGKFHGLPLTQLKEGFGTSLNYGEAAYKVLQEDSSLLEWKSQTEFVHHLCQKIDAQKENDLILRGEASLIFSFVCFQTAQSTHQFLSELLFIHSFIGHIMRTQLQRELRDKSYQSVEKQLIQDQFRHSFNINIIDLIADKIEGLDFDQTESIQVANSYMEGLQEYLDMISKSMPKDRLGLIEKLFQSNPNDQTTPLAFKAFKKVYEKYRTLYKTFEDETTNRFRVLSNNAKDWLNDLTFNLIFLISDQMENMFEACDGDSGFYQVSPEYYSELKNFLQELLKLVTSFSFTSNYTSLIVFNVSVTALYQARENTISKELGITMHIVRKLEEITLLAATKEFDEMFLNSKSAEPILQTPKLFIPAFKNLLDKLQDTAEIFIEEIDYLNDVTTFKTIDLISKNYIEASLNCESQYTKEFRERIIALQIISSLKVQTRDVSEQVELQIGNLVFYTLDRLKQVWTIIKACNFSKKSIMKAFFASHEVIQHLQTRPEEGQNNLQLRDLFDVENMTFIFERGLFGIDFAFLDQDETETLESLLTDIFDNYQIINSSEYANLLLQISTELKECFQNIYLLNKQLQEHHRNNSIEFEKRFLEAKFRMKDFFSLLRTLIEFMQNDPESFFSLRQALADNFVELIACPIFYTGDSEVLAELAEDISNCFNAEDNLIFQILPDFAQKVKGEITFIENQIKDNPKDLGIINLISSYRFLRSHAENTCEALKDPRQTFLLYSEIFPSNYFKALNFEDPSNGNREKNFEWIEKYMKTIREDLSQSLASIVNISYVKTTAGLKGLIDLVNLEMRDPQFFDDPVYSSWIEVPATIEYFQEKIEILLNMLQTHDSQKTKAQQFLYKLSVFQTLQMTILALRPPPLHQVLEKEQLLEKMIEEAFNLLTGYADLVQNHDSHEYLSSQQAKFNQSEEGWVSEKTGVEQLYNKVFMSIRQFFNVLSNYCGARRPLRSVAEEQELTYLQRIWKPLLANSEKLSPRLLSFVAFENQGSLAVSEKVNFIYHLYLYIANRLHDIKLKCEPEENQGRVPRRKQRPGRNRRNHRNRNAPMGSLFGNAPRGIPLPFSSDPVIEPEIQKEDEQAVPAAEEETQTSNATLLAEERHVLQKILPNILFFYSRENLPTPILRKNYNDLIKEYFQSLETEIASWEDKILDNSTILDAQVYKNKTLNFFRNLASLLYFVTDFREEPGFENQSEFDYYLSFSNLLTNQLKTLVDKFQLQDVLNESSTFVERDLLPKYVLILESLTKIHQHKILSYLKTQKSLDDVYQDFEVLWSLLDKYAEIMAHFPDIKDDRYPQHFSENLLFVVYFNLKNPVTYEKFVKDQKVFNFLADISKKFYMLAQLYALQAYNPETILSIKLKSLVSLDNTGESLVYNKNIKSLEKYWPDQLQKVWNENFEIQESSAINTNNRLHSNKIIRCKDYASTTLDFFKNGISQTAKTMIENLMEGIVSYIKNLLIQKISNKPSEEKQYSADNHTSLFNRIGSLAVLMKNYPELSVLVTSWKINVSLDIPTEYTEVLPAWSPDDTFLIFFIKHACYFFNISASYLLEFFVNKNETPILIDHNGQTILLSVYNESLIFEQVVKLLQDLSQDSEKFLQTFFSLIYWDVLTTISIRLLNLSSHSIQSKIKLQIVDQLEQLCLRILKVYNNSQETNQKQKEKIKLICIFLSQLKQVEITLRSKSLFGNSPLPEDLNTPQNLLWVCSTLKENFYDQQSTMFIPQNTQDIIMNIEPSKILENDNNHNSMIDFDIFLAKIVHTVENCNSNEPNLPGHKRFYDHHYDGLYYLTQNINSLLEIKDFSNISQEGPKLFIQTFANFWNMYSAQNCSRFSEFQFEERYLPDASRLSSFEANNDSTLPRPKKIPKVQKAMKKALEGPAPKVEIQQPKNDQMENESSDPANNNIMFENLQPAFTEEPNWESALDHESLVALSEGIKKNKSKIKQAIVQQHEKFILAKFEALLQKQINIRDILNVQTDVDNLKFFNEQTPADKKLIMVLADQSFINSLGPEIKKQSVPLRKCMTEQMNSKFQQEMEDQQAWSDDEPPAEDEEEKAQIEENNNSRDDFDKEIEEKNEDEKAEGEDENKEMIEEIKSSNKSDQHLQDEDGLEEDDMIQEDEDDLEEDDMIQEDEDENEDGEEEDDFPEEEEEEEKMEIEEEEEEKEDINEVEEAEIKEEKPNLEENKEENNEIESSMFSYPDVEENVGRGGLFGGHNRNDRIKKYDHLQQDFSFDFDEGEAESKKEYETFMTQYQNTKKNLEKTKISFALKTIEIKDSINQPSLKEWVENACTLLKKAEDRSVDSSTDLLYQNLTSIIFGYLDVSLLDPLKETLLISLLTLHTCGFRVKCLGEQQNDLETRILGFLFQYALRSPSVFYQTFAVDDFKEYLEESPLEIQRSSPFGLLIKASVKEFKKESLANTRRGYNQLIGLLFILTFARFLYKKEESPSSIQKLRENETKSELQELFNIQLHKGEDNYDNIESLCLLFKNLSSVSQYQKPLLDFCNNMLKDQLSGEKESMRNFIDKAKSLVQSSSADTGVFDQVSVLKSDLSNLRFLAPTILNLLSTVVNQIQVSALHHFLNESGSLQESLEEISMIYLDTLDLVSQLQQKKFLLKIGGGFEDQLTKMLNVPLQYYMYASRLKELTSANQPQGANIQRGKTIQFSRLGSEYDVGKTLHRSYSTLQNEGVNLQELLPSWVNKHRTFVNDLMKNLKLENKASLEIVEKFPWILGFDVKQNLFKDSLDQQDDNEEYEYDDEKIIFVRRDNILEDTVKQFEYIAHKDIIKNSKVEFIKEPGVDAGGLKKEWLTLLAKELFDTRNGLFQLSPNSRTIHPHPLSIIQPDALTYFNLAGLIVGLAIKEGIPINVSFSKSFLKLIMDIQPNMNDLEDIDPELVSSWRWMLKNDVSDLEQPFMYELDVFGTKIVQELCENGSETIVDDLNKNSYISEMCYAKSYNEVKQQVISFKNGFFEVIKKDLLRIFSSGELEVLISGLSEIDVQDMIKHLQFKDVKNKKLVQWFKEILEILDQSLLANLLFFVTGTTQVPHEGFKGSPIAIIESSFGIASLPIAHTCFRQLEVPAYESKEQFYEKLILAISEGREGFYIA